MRFLIYTIKGKLALSYSLIIFFALTFLGLFSYYTYADSIREKTQNQMDIVARSINIYCDQLFDEIDTMSLIAVQSDVLQKACVLPYSENQHYSIQQIYAENETFTYLNNLYTLKPLIDSFMVFSDNGMNFYYHPFKTWNTSIDSREESWYRDAVQADGKWIVTPLHNNRQLYTLFMQQADKDLEVATFARVIKSSRNLRTIGVIAIDIKADFLEEIATMAGAGGVINILRSDGTAITRNPLEEGREYITITQVSSKTGFTIQYSYYTDQLYQEISAVGRTISLIVISLILASLMISLLVSHNIIKPIQRLRNQMSLVGQGRFETIESPTRDWEIRQMYQSFNYMVDQIERLIEEISLKEQQRMRHELYAIQVSINPHFIYNTLNCIRWTAIIDGNTTITNPVSSFIAILKTSVTRRGEFITIREELDFIRSYCDLMRLRYENFTVNIEVQPGAEDCLILPFLIQPLVENAIFHGIAPLKERPGIIDVVVSLYEEMIMVKIADNGVGMDMRQLDYGDSRGQGMMMKIGVGSVRERIAIYYKELGSFELSSEENNGVRITMRWPQAYMEGGSEEFA